MGAMANSGLLVVMQQNPCYTSKMPTLICKICESEFERSEYRLSKTSGRYCSIACSNKARVIRVEEGDKRLCTRCGAFNDNFRPKSLTRCRECENESRRKWYAANRSKAIAMSKRSHFRRKYGIEPDQYEKMLENGCWICNSNENLVVDHDHVSGKTRNILCQNCNKGLGHFRDNPELLNKAKDYLCQGWW